MQSRFDGQVFEVLRRRIGEHRRRDRLYTYTSQPELLNRGTSPVSRFNG